MEEKNYVLDLERIFQFVFDSDNDKNVDSELTELYVMDDETNNLSLSSKQVREIKSNEINNKQTIRYDMVKFLLTSLISMSEEEVTFGETIMLNTMFREGIIKEVIEDKDDE